MSKDLSIIEKNTIPAVEQFRKLMRQDRFNGWPLVGQPELGAKIPFFGETFNYKLQTGKGVEEYTSIIRHFGWAVCFGVVLDKNQPSHIGPHVVTLCQWKPGVNGPSWELPPGGIGKVDSKATLEEITENTKQVYLKETGLGNGDFKYLGRIMIETGKYRGADFNDHGLPAHLFLATNLERVQDTRQPNSNEIMETIMVPIHEFPDVLESGLFVEESAVACAYKALIKLGFLRWNRSAS